MKRLTSELLIATVACGFIAGCATDGQSSGNSMTIGGAVMGAILGGAVAATASHGNAGASVAGALAGGLVGGLVGRQFDERDRQARDAALAKSLQTSKANEVVAWSNPMTGNSGTIKPLRGYTKAANSPVCRDFGESYTREGRTYNQPKARACRDENGMWKVVSS